MRYRLVVAAIVGVAFVVPACDDPAPTELTQDTTPSVSAAPKHATPFTAALDLNGPVFGMNIINPECITVDAKHYHFDKCIFAGSVTGDLGGNLTHLHRGRISLETGVGTGHGHFTWNVCHTDGRCGTFKGRYHTESTTVPSKWMMRSGTGHGSGDFHTLQIRFTSVKRANSFDLDVEGVIF